MTKKSIFLATIVSFVLFLNIFVPYSYAAPTPPEFSSCVNPQGTVKADYSSGTHGVPGVTTSYQGSDTVYNISGNALTQCLCTVDGEGIQTNWWKVSSLTSQEIETFKTQGWVFIPDGSAWGLDPVTYLAKNANYSCRGRGGGDILGLASTGNIMIIYGLILIGALSFCIGFLLKRRQTK